MNKTRKSAAFFRQLEIQRKIFSYKIHYPQVDPYLPPEPAQRVYPPVPDRRVEEALDFYAERDRCLSVGYNFFGTSQLFSRKMNNGREFVCKNL